MNWRLALPILFVLPLDGRADDVPTGGRRTLIVRETAGIRRFGCLASVKLPLGRSVRDSDRFRLLADGKPMTAQFRPVRGENGTASAVFCDFIVSPGPLEKRTYTVEYGPDVKPGPEPKNGLKIEKTEDTVAVVHPGGLTFAMPRGMRGLLRQVRTKDTEYLKTDSPGLLLRAKGGGEIRLGDTPATVKVQRDGPIAVGLRFESREKMPNGSRVSSVVDMEFPVTKSWVRITWTVIDKGNDVAGLSADLRMNVPDAPVLVDFGAGSYVYATLRKGQTAVLRAGRLDASKADRPAWETLLGSAGALRPYVVALPKERRAAEGWAHVMDRHRCTAVAVEGFADVGQESGLRVDADGRLRISRTFAASDKPKCLSFWLHFVDTPVQVGAATSPQSMLAPLRVEVKPSSEPRP